MKKLFLAAMILMFCATANAATVSFPPTTDGGEPTGYMVYYEDVTEGKVYKKDAGLFTSTEIFFWPGHEYNVSAAAYNDAGEGGRSGITNYTAPLFIPSSDEQAILIVIPGRAGTPRVE